MGDGANFQQCIGRVPHPPLNRNNRTGLDLIPYHTVFAQVFISGEVVDTGGQRVFAHLTRVIIDVWEAKTFIIPTQGGIGIKINRAVPVGSFRQRLKIFDLGL